MSIMSKIKPNFTLLSQIHFYLFFPLSRFFFLSKKRAILEMSKQKVSESGSDLFLREMKNHSYWLKCFNVYSN